jgi:hypothetical protein
MTTSTSPRQHLLMLLGDGHAHMGFDEAIRDFPAEAMNRKVPNATYTPWHILEHMRLVQLDTLNYMEQDAAEYKEPEWPVDFWPAEDATADEAAWNETIAQFRSDLARMAAIAGDEGRDLSAPIPSNPEHDLLRSIYIVAAHNHYHIGEFAALRQVMGTWGARHEM